MHGSSNIAKHSCSEQVGVSGITSGMSWRHELSSTTKDVGTWLHVRETGEEPENV